MTVEYLDAKRIQGSSTSAKTPTFSDDFSSDSGWTLNAGGSGQVVTGGYISTPSGASGYKAFAIGTPDDFIMDFDWAILGTDSPSLILSSTTNGYGDPADGHKRLIIFNNGGMKISSRYNDGGANEDNVIDTNDQPATDGTIAYYRFVKNGNNMNLKRYDSASNRTAGTSVQQTCNIATINGSPEAADYI